jgi:hypothetical protein
MEPSEEDTVHKESTSAQVATYSARPFKKTRENPRKSRMLQFAMEKYMNETEMIICIENGFW